MSSFAQLIIAIATITTALTALISVVMNRKLMKNLDAKIDDVHTEVKTGNSQTMAELADAAESRRIKEKPLSKRTAQEKSHLREA